jgi:DNA-binding CsgD family transcriptional regulator
MNAPPAGPGSSARSAFVAPSHLMRLRRLHGAGKVLYLLILEPFRSRDTVRVAARRYALTKREHEILILILEGANAPEIAMALHISEHTVQGYFKRLLKKTRSRNRAAMVANVLEWSRGATKERGVGAPRSRGTAEGETKR